MGSFLAAQWREYIYSKYYYDIELSIKSRLKGRLSKFVRSDLSLKNVLIYTIIQHSSA